MLKTTGKALILERYVLSVGERQRRIAANLKRRLRPMKVWYPSLTAMENCVRC